MAEHEQRTEFTAPVSPNAGGQETEVKPAEPKPPEPAAEEWPKVSTPEASGQAIKLRKALRDGKEVPPERLEWLREYSRRYSNVGADDPYGLKSKGGRPKRQRDLEFSQPPEPPPTVTQYRGGRRIVTAGQAPTTDVRDAAAAESCGDPDCWRCGIKGRVCTVTNKTIHPKPTDSEVDTFSRLILRSVAFGVVTYVRLTILPGCPNPPIDEREVESMRPGMRDFVHRRLGFMKGVSDLAAAGDQLGLAIARRQELMGEVVRAVQAQQREQQSAPAPAQGG